MVIIDSPTGPPIATATGGRRLVVCCDGTSNQPNRSNPTNVLRVARGVLPEDSLGVSQVVFYDWGVGTSGKLDTITGGAFGKGLEKNVEDAYRFLVHNYRPGDRVFIFGFSRGAFTARSVAGLIRQCSILRKEHADQVENGYWLYRDRDIAPGDQQSEEWRKKFSHPMPLIEFIGVWDTVGALGIPANRIGGALRYWTWEKWFGKRKKHEQPDRPGMFTSLPRNRHSFHDIALSSIVKNAYHALAIDERRPVFTASTWQTPPKEYTLPDGTKAPQVVRQAWFPGAHSDVGGGNSRVNASAQSLNWIARAASISGLEFDPAFWDEVQEQAGVMGEISASPPGIWRLAGSTLRDMSSNVSCTEFIHSSARDRQQNYSPAYKPDNLLNSPLPDLETPGAVNGAASLQPEKATAT